MGELSPKPEGYYLETEDACTKHVEELVDRTVKARNEIDIAATTNASVKEQKLRYKLWGMRYGHALGALATMHRTKQISDNCYGALYAKVEATTKASLIVPAGG